MYLDTFKHWPDACEIGSYAPALSIATLLPDQRRLLWRHLKISHPDKAQSISAVMEDAAVLELMEKFGAELLLEEKYVPEQLRWLIRK